MAGDLLLPGTGLTLVMISRDSMPRWAGWGLLAYWAWQKFVTPAEPTGPTTTEEIVPTPTIDDLIVQADADNWHSVFLPESKQPADLDVTRAQLYLARDMILDQQQSLPWGVRDQTPYIGDGFYATQAGNIVIIQTNVGLKVAGSSGLDAYGDPAVYADGI